ncbi:MAG: lysophospholipid acyltransferase family protein [Armatimonadota bacterium]
MFYQLGKFFCWCIVKFFGRLKVIGAEHIPATGGVMLASNHVSYIDPPLVGVGSPRPVWFMGKSELFANPVVNWIFRNVHAFPVKRGAVDREALKTVHGLLTSGKALTIFIEGGTSPDGRLQPPSLGPAMMALRAGAPIVPTAVINSDHLLPRHGKWLKFARVTVVYGPPLAFPHLAGKHADREALREVSETVMRHIAELMRAHGAADRVPEGYLEQGGCAATTDESSTQ